MEHLYQLRTQTDLSVVSIETGEFKKNNVLRYALKYALWAVRPGGQIEISDDGPDTYDISLMKMPFSIVRQNSFKVYRQDADLVELDEKRLRLVFRRSRPITPPGWSAGLIFSGNVRELPFVRHAIAGIRAQPEISEAAGGQIMICGPAAAKKFFENDADIDYVCYEETSRDRTFTTRKKTLLVEAARNPRVAIMHARIVLEPGCLAAFPREFDVSTPRVVYREGDREIPYLDWVVAHDFAFDRLPRRLQSPLHYDRQRHLAQLSTGGLPYIDGGVFVSMRDVYREVPLNPFLAWGEGEDNEWCARLQAEGYLVDLQSAARATSQSFKLSRRHVEHPRVSRNLSALRRIVDDAFFAFR